MRKEIPVKAEKKEVQRIFKDYHRLDHGMKKELKKLGLTVSKSGKDHWKVENERNGNSTFLPNTPSDWRSGRNCAKYVYLIL